MWEIRVRRVEVGGENAGSLTMVLGAIYSEMRRHCWALIRGMKYDWHLKELFCCFV